MKKILISIIILVLLFLILFPYIKSNIIYNSAKNYTSKENYEEAIECYEKILNFKDSKELLEETKILLNEHEKLKKEAIYSEILKIKSYGDSDRIIELCEEVGNYENALEIKKNTISDYIYNNFNRNDEKTKKYIKNYLSDFKELTTDEIKSLFLDAGYAYLLKTSSKGESERQEVYIGSRDIDLVSYDFEPFYSYLIENGKFYFYYTDLIEAKETQECVMYELGKNRYLVTDKKANSRSLTETYIFVIKK